MENRRKKMKNEKGVTMIALVVTIMLMIIIAGVSLNLAMLSDNSIVKKIKDETDTQQRMVNEENKKTSNVIKRYEKEWGIS